jgi:hypothetical protein
MFPIKSLPVTKTALKMPQNKKSKKLENYIKRGKVDFLNSIKKGKPYFSDSIKKASNK